jgi:hypothetical protein
MHKIKYNVAKVQLGKTQTMTMKLNKDNGVPTRWTRTPAGNRRLVKWRVKWLIEHSTSYQLLCWVESLVLRNPLLRQAPNCYASLKNALEQ